MSLQKAIRIASIKHGESVDKGGQPFIGHPLRVMAKVAAQHDNVPEWVLEAAVCHDVLEDTGTDPQELVTAGVSSVAISVVSILTRSDNEGYFDYIARIKEIATNETRLLGDRSGPGYWAVQIKLADLSDNLNPKRRVPGLKLPDRYERAVALLQGEEPNE